MAMDLSRPETRTRLALGLFVLFYCLGVAGNVFLENLSLLDAAYFTLVTVTTVGYGDIHPTTPLGKLLAMSLILSGVTAFTAALAYVTEDLRTRHERQERLSRLNMVIGSFLSEVGSTLLARFTAWDPNIEKPRALLAEMSGLSEPRIRDIRAALKDYPFEVRPTAEDLGELREFLNAKTGFLLRVLENPNLGEHEAFTDLIWAVFHARDELAARGDLRDLPDTDLAHLRGDMKRAYALLVTQWLAYMRHLKTDYPYLFSLAVRTNPFDPKASPTVKS